MAGVDVCEQTEQAIWLWASDLVDHARRRGLVALAAQLAGHETAAKFAAPDLDAIDDATFERLASRLVA